MTVDETMTYFSGFHSRRAPRLFHSRFLASSLCLRLGRGRARMHARTHAHSRCLGCNIVRLPPPLLLASTASFLPYPPPLTARRSSLRYHSLSLSFSIFFPHLVKPFDYDRFSPSFFQPVRCHARDLLDHLESESKRAKGGARCRLGNVAGEPRRSRRRRRRRRREKKSRKKKKRKRRWLNLGIERLNEFAVDQRNREETKRKRERERETRGINRHGWVDERVTRSRNLEREDYVASILLSAEERFPSIRRKNGGHRHEYIYIYIYVFSSFSFFFFSPFFLYTINEIKRRSRKAERRRGQGGGEGVREGTIKRTREIWRARVAHSRDTVSPLCTYVPTSENYTPLCRAALAAERARAPGELSRSLARIVCRFFIVPFICTDLY